MRKTKISLLVIVLVMVTLVMASCGDPWKDNYKVLVNKSSIVFDNDGSIVGGRVETGKVEVTSEVDKIDGIFAVRKDTEFTFSVKITYDGNFNIKTMVVSFNGETLTKISDITEGGKVVGYNYKTVKVDKHSTLAILTPLVGAV